jgi:CheY-like chemotaxis protein
MTKTSTSFEPFETFAEALRDALAHLHDPDYVPADVLYTVLGSPPEGGAAAVQSVVLRHIRDLKPLADLPQDTRVHQHFELLHHRYVLKLTQEQTAEALHMSVRSVRRTQRAATHALARRVWEQYLARATEAAPAGTEEEQPTRWRTQIRQDLIALQAKAPASLCSVGEAVRYAVNLESRRLARLDIALRAAPVPSDLTTTIHPSVLRQVLIMAIGEVTRALANTLTRSEGTGALVMRAVPGDDGETAEVVLSVELSAPSRIEAPDGQFVEEILTVLGGETRVAHDAASLTMTLVLPLVRQIKVLVIDDNLDQVHFYRRCVMGTKYVIVHAERGERTVAHVADVAPDIIVLDVIMPDADGWALLSQLREDPATRHIPVILCSIVREGDLADALGADLYLPKPIQYREFLDALDRVLACDPSAAPIDPAR